MWARSTWVLAAVLALWSTAARAEDATTADVKTLEGVIGGQDKTTKVKPILERLKAVVDAGTNADDVKAAEQIAGKVAEYGRKTLAWGRQLESRQPGDAEALYKNLTTQFAGMGIAAEAADRLKDHDFMIALRAWAYYERLVDEEKKLKDVPGARRSIKDQKFAEANRLRLEVMQGIAHDVKQSYPNSAAAGAAKQLIAKYEMTP